MQKSQQWHKTQAMSKFFKYMFYFSYPLTKGRIIIMCCYLAFFYQFIQTIKETHENRVLIKYVLQNPGPMKKVDYYLKNKKNSSHFRRKIDSYKRPNRFPTDLIFILKWTQAYIHYSSAIQHKGQQAFIQSNCSNINCFITTDRALLNDIRNFDAILLDAENNWDPMPSFRAPHQNYIFVSSESASSIPICDPNFDSFYNLTWTYKLDSDIKWSYITIVDKEGNIIGPKTNMTWISPMLPVSNNLKKILNTKTKGIAWFVSNCYSLSGREKVAKDLLNALKKYNIGIDVYGWCGNYSCTKDNFDGCLKVLEKDYHFYLAFENSLSEDYVTEKVLYPLQQKTVPIVFGGADYSRFLPPNSYLNAGKEDPYTLASKINLAMKNKEVYYEYFRWHNHYKYVSEPAEKDACQLCKVLNERTRNRRSVNFSNFREWWFPGYVEFCMSSNWWLQHSEQFIKHIL